MPRAIRITSLDDPTPVAAMRDHHTNNDQDTEQPLRLPSGLRDRGSLALDEVPDSRGRPKDKHQFDDAVARIIELSSRGRAYVIEVSEERSAEGTRTTLSTRMKAAGHRLYTRRAKNTDGTQTLYCWCEPLEQSAAR